MTVLGIEEYGRLSARRIAAAVGSGDLSAHETVLAALARIARDDPAVRAFTEVWPEQAMARAAEVDRQVRAGEHLPLAGVPLGVKRTEGRDSHQSVRLLRAGCVPVGATATPGRGTPWQTWGATDRGPTLNPRGKQWSPGGSSAGSAAAVAAGMVPLATGSDGAGSVRIPAAWCAITGLKPTNGRVPARDRAGLNVAGPLARYARDAAVYLDALAGTALGPYLARPARPLRTAWSATLGFADTLDRVAEPASAFLDRLARARAVVRSDAPVRLPDPAECWYARRGRTSDRPAPEPGSGSPSLHRALDGAFTGVDLLATPTTPHPPHGHQGPGSTINTALTWAFNITGHPAVSIPAGCTAAGEPVGLQLVARHGREADLLAVAAAAEQITAPH
ncbi:amidase [Streptomyces sp. TP-A0874]|uniref:amidase n=1 Tax=Streptomyces sp. TP-A0874 TaxID=549819 RepID=UPI000852D606|nr:amidase family protein [Streptomyces sp. TP-A0874]